MVYCRRASVHQLIVRASSPRPFVLAAVGIAALCALDAAVNALTRSYSVAHAVLGRYVRNRLRTRRPANVPREISYIEERRRGLMKSDDTVLVTLSKSDLPVSGASSPSSLESKARRASGS
jgi:hypothetical protein